MHYAVLFAVALVASACSSKASLAKPELDPDAGAAHAADAAKMPADAAGMPADAAAPSALERARLPRPPSDGHLPAELRPPR
jgi:hypothetical protein